LSDRLRKTKRVGVCASREAEHDFRTRMHENRRAEQDEPAKALSIEAPWSEEANGTGHLEARAAQTGGVGDERDKRPVGVFNRYAEDKRGAHLHSEAQVDKSDLATLR